MKHFPSRGVNYRPLPGSGETQGSVCKCKILETVSAKTKDWQLVIENIQCEVASEGL